MAASPASPASSALPARPGRLARLALLCVVVLAASGCMVQLADPRAGGKAPRTARTVEEARAPNLLVDRDGWVCTIPTGKHRNVKRGDVVSCRWLAPGEARPPLPVPVPDGGAGRQP